MSRKIDKISTASLLRRIEILEVDVDCIGRDRENLIQEMGLQLERIKKLEDRLAFLNAQFREVKL